MSDSSPVLGDLDAGPQRLYFGCWDTSSGHWLRDEYGQQIPFDHERNRFSVIDSAKIDGGFVPKDRNRRHGDAKLWHAADWTILALHDYSRDQRGGSNANFLLRGTHTFEEVMADARKHFARQVELIEATGPIRLVEVHSAPEAT
jgi:hypothetical protein